MKTYDDNIDNDNNTSEVNSESISNDQNSVEEKKDSIFDNLPEENNTPTKNSKSKKTKKLKTSKKNTKKLLKSKGPKRKSHPIEKVIKLAIFLTILFGGGGYLVFFQFKLAPVPKFISNFYTHGYERYDIIELGDIFTIDANNAQGEHYIYFYNPEALPCVQLEDLIFDFAEKQKKVYFVNIKDETSVNSNIVADNPESDDLFLKYPPYLVKLDGQIRLTDEELVDIYTAVKSGNEANVINLSEDSSDPSFKYFSFVDGAFIDAYYKDTSEKTTLYKIDHTVQKKQDGFTTKVLETYNGAKAISDYLATLK